MTRKISELEYDQLSGKYSSMLDLNGNDEPWTDEGLYRFISEELETEDWEVVEDEVSKV